MQAGNIIRTRTKSATDLTGAAAQNAMITVDIQDQAIGAGGTCRSRIKSISIVSVQNLAWEVNFFGTADYVSVITTPDTVHFLGRYAFQVADGTQIAGTGFFLYYIDGLDIPYQDIDVTNLVRNPPPGQAGKIHIGIVNRSATAKIAGASGALTLGLGVEPTLTGQ